jgi:hypothetical protein
MLTEAAIVAAVMRAGAAVTHASHPFKELREQISRSNDVGAPCLNERWGSSPMYSSDGLDLPGLWSKKLGVLEKSWFAVYLRSAAHDHHIHGRGSAPSAERISKSLAFLTKGPDSQLAQYRQCAH